MKKVFVLLLTLVFVVAMAAGCSTETQNSSASASTSASTSAATSAGTSAGTSSSAATGDPIKIGYVGPLTGDASPWGISELNMLKMLTEETNANGGILGRKIQITSYDNRADNVETQNAARKLIQQDGVCSIIGTNSSGASIALASVCEENKVPHIATTATNAQVTIKDGKTRPYTFRVCLIDPQLGALMAEYAFNELNVKTCAILYELGSDYSIGVKDAFVQSFEKLGGKLTTIEAYKTGDVDFRAQLSKIKEGNPQGVFLPALYKQIALAVKQARDLGIKSVFLGGDTWLNNDILTLAASAVEGSYFDQPCNVDDPVLEPLKAKYKAKYNDEMTAMGGNAIFAYDAFSILKAAIEKANSTDPQKIRDELEKTKDVQGCITKISINPETHNCDRPAIMMTVKDGKFAVVKQY